jgi:hypothetical protein
MTAALRALLARLLGRTTCPHCRATESVRLTPDMRRCGRCYGRYPEPG